MTYEEVTKLPADYIISEIRRRLNAEFYIDYKQSLDKLFVDLDYEMRAFHGDSHD